MVARKFPLTVHKKWNKTTVAGISPPTVHEIVVNLNSDRKISINSKQFHVKPKRWQEDLHEQ